MKKSLSILVIVFLFVAVLRLTSITYGYYSTRVIENKNENSLSIVSKVLKIEYEDGTSIMNFKGDYIFPGDSAEKLWSVKNTGTDLVSYNVLVENVSNNFERIQDLRYVLYINNEEVSNGAINNNLKQYLFTNKEINAGATDSIKLVFVYDETEEIQNADMNKTISFKVNIDTNTVNSVEGQTLTYLSNNVINNYRIYGKSLQETIPNGEYTPIYSVGDLVTDETSEYYGKYKIPVKVSGKNLYDIDSAVDNSALVKNEDGSYTLLKTENNDRFAKTVKVNLKAGKTYTFSYELIDTNSSYKSKVQFQVKFDDGTETTWSAENIARVLTKNVVSLGIYQEGSMPTGTYTTFKNLQIEEGNTKTGYEPYKEPVTADIYLNEPLRGIDEYSDYIDFKKQSVVRQVKSIVFTGNEQIYLLPNQYNYNYYVLGDTGLVVNDKSLSSHFELQTNFSFTLEGPNKYRIYNSADNKQSRIGFRMLENGLVIKDVEKIKDNMSIAYQNGTPYTFYYVGSEVAEKYINIPKLTTFDGTNIIEVDTSVKPSNMYLEYYNEGE